LLSYEEVRQKLKAESSTLVGLQDIPLAAIVGSVGRYTDFTRSFLPLRDSDVERWVRIETAMNTPRGLPPIDVYQIGEVYFVSDGNHRVSVARQRGDKTILAYVTEVRSRIPLSPQDRPDDLIIKAEYADFLKRTRLDELVPEAELRVSAPAQYVVLLDHIEIHRQMIADEHEHEVLYPEAVTSWYHDIYLPVVQAVREQGLLREFPGRTEGDLYLWLSQHRERVEQELGWSVAPEAAAISLAERFGRRPGRVLARVSDKIIEAVRPAEFEPGPRPGEWRKERLATRRNDRLSGDVLVGVSGQEAGWHAVDQAIELARREGARLHGLHVALTEQDASNNRALAARDEFERRCATAGISAEFVIEAGQVAHWICKRAWWNDLIVLSLLHPPAPHKPARLASGFRTILRGCPRPVLAVPPSAPFPRRALLAYDGSRKAEEALFIASYLAAEWKMPLVVLTVTESGRVTLETLEHAQAYLKSHGAQAQFAKRSGRVAEAILKGVDRYQCDLIIMGGYGLSPVFEVVLGSTVDQVLRESRRTVLICR
jgi:nucleotide-binding universal stress UspA family protein